MSSRRATLTTDLSQQLSRIGLQVTASGLDDFIARATKHRWSPAILLEEIVRAESQDRARRSLERRLRNARLGRFKPIADFDWNWPRKIDRSLIESALSLDFISEGRNLILLGANGLGKTMISKNIAHQAVLQGHSVLFRTAPDLLADLSSDYPHIRRRKLTYYGRPALLCID
jgi:DNA replication protein DnaC